MNWIFWKRISREGSANSTRTINSITWTKTFPISICSAWSWKGLSSFPIAKLQTLCLSPRNSLYLVLMSLCSKNLEASKYLTSLSLLITKILWKMTTATLSANCPSKNNRKTIFNQLIAWKETKKGLICLKTPKMQFKNL